MAITTIRPTQVDNSNESIARPSKNRPVPENSQWGKFSAKAPIRSAQKRVQEKKEDKRWQHELKEMQETHDLEEVDDDVEAATTLFEWHAEEHEHRPKSPVWFAMIAATITILVSTLLFIFTNIMGAVTVALVGGLIYYIAQQEPSLIRYRIMLDGVALNDTMYHWEDLNTFNIIYEPDETKTIIFKSEKLFSPLILAEIGDADPLEIRDVLMEYLEEDQELQEPLIDIVARRLGF